MRLWEHQQRALDDVAAAVLGGSRRIVVASPTGSGKTVIQSEMAGRCAATGKRVVLLTNRRILLKQCADQLVEHGVDFAVVSSEWEQYLDSSCAVQLCSIPTLWARRERVELPAADLVLVDEAHSNHRGDMAWNLLEHYRQRGAVLVGFTATPVGLAAAYDTLVVAAKTSELLAKGVLVPCDVFAPNQPDVDGVKVVNGEYSARDLEKRVRSCTVFGHVYPHWDKINPAHLPTVMWAPGKDFSRWFVKMFNDKGVPAAHVDGSTPDAEREDIFGRLNDGRLTIVSSCGVLREGWNAPSVACGILLQPCRSLSTYIQIAGRLLRSHPGKEKAILLDHAGAVWAHGSPTNDIDWELGDTNHSIQQRAKKKRKENGEGPGEGICCPQCHFVRQAGPICPRCGHTCGESVRFVRQTDGKLVKRVSASMTPAQAKQADIQRKWDSCFWRCRKAKKELTFSQVKGLFKSEHGCWPPEGLLRMPAAGSPDWKRKVKEVAEGWR